MSLPMTFYDSLGAVTAYELVELYGYTTWGRSRSIESVTKMLSCTDLAFSVRYDGRLVAFCRMLTDFTFQAILCDMMVHPDVQGHGLGTALVEYALGHPLVKNLPKILVHSNELREFFEGVGFTSENGLLLLRRD